jgi:hypothetical protein
VGGRAGAQGRPRVLPLASDCAEMRADLARRA